MDMIPDQITDAHNQAEKNPTLNLQKKHTLPALGEWLIKVPHGFQCSKNNELRVSRLRVAVVEVDDGCPMVIT